MMRHFFTYSGHVVIFKGNSQPMIGSVCTKPFDAVKGDGIDDDTANAF